MGNNHHNYSTCVFSDALDILPDFILIAGLRDDADTPTGDTTTVQLRSVCFINTALRQHLGFQVGAYIPPSVVHSLYDLELKDDGLYHGRALLENAAKDKIIFSATGKINTQEGICSMKLTSFRDECFILRKFFDSTAVFMSVMELDPNAGEYEWRHIVANSFACKSKKRDFFEFAAHKRFSLEDRKLAYRCVDASKTSKLPTEFQQVSVPGDVSPPTIFVQYICTDPNTKTDLASVIMFDFASVKSGKRRRIVELANFFEEAPMLMGIVEYRADNLAILQYANSITATLLKLPQCCDVNLETIYPPYIMDEYREIYKKTRARIGEMDQRIIHYRDKYWQSTVSCLSYDKKTGLSSHVFILEDKTEQKIVELELARHRASLEQTLKERTLEIQEKEQRFRSIVSNAPNIIISVNRSGVIEYANRHFLGGDVSQLIGKYLYMMVVEGPDLMEKMKVLFETKKSFISEVKLVDTDLWLNLSVGTMNDNLAIVVATDITEMKKLSEELHDAVTTKSRFLANMSHEVRTPLSGIIGMARILMESGLSLDQTECVATIQYCGETLLSVINSILDYTKLEASEVSMATDKSELSLQQCIEESLYTVLPAAQKKKLELIIDVDPRIPDRILGDTIRLRQVIINLLNNAVKFTDEGYVLVMLTGTENFEKDEWRFQFIIKDTGCGVPPESQTKLFQMFSQVDVSTTRRYGGTGIGLALARRFLEMMGGDIMMQSSGVAGEGSAFYFTLTATPAPFAPVSPSGLASPRRFTVATAIYIIDTCKIGGEVLKKRLEAKGFFSIQLVTGDPASFFEKIATFSLSPKAADSNILVFVDTALLTSGKYPLLGSPHVATVFMGYVRPKNFETDYPDSDFLRKPIKESALIRSLRDVCGKFDKQKAVPLQLPVAKKPQPQSFSILNILVVEDNEINQKVVKRVFQHLGYAKNITIANHGMEALEMIEKHGLPDFILMDVQMPVLDGMQTTKIIRERYPALSNVPYIVSMTANAFPEDRKLCIEAGMNDFLTKPIRVEQLQTTLQKCEKLKAILSQPHTGLERVSSLPITVDTPLLVHSHSK